jgi:hypothetical protein
VSGDAARPAVYPPATRPLGDESFLATLEKDLGGILKPQRPGPKTTLLNWVWCSRNLTTNYNDAMSHEIRWCSARSVVFHHLLTLRLFNCLELHEARVNSNACLASYTFHDEVEVGSLRLFGSAWVVRLNILS